MPVLRSRRTQTVRRYQVPARASVPCRQRRGSPKRDRRIRGAAASHRGLRSRPAPTRVARAPCLPTSVTGTAPMRRRKSVPPSPMSADERRYHRRPERRPRGRAHQPSRACRATPTPTRCSRGPDDASAMSPHRPTTSEPSAHSESSSPSAPPRRGKKTHHEPSTAVLHREEPVPVAELHPRIARDERPELRETRAPRRRGADAARFPEPFETEQVLARRDVLPEVGALAVAAAPLLAGMLGEAIEDRVGRRHREVRAASLGARSTQAFPRRQHVTCRLRLTSATVVRHEKDDAPTSGLALSARVLRGAWKRHLFARRGRGAASSASSLLPSLTRFRCRAEIPRRARRDPVLGVCANPSSSSTGRPRPGSLAGHVRRETDPSRVQEALLTVSSGWTRSSWARSHRPASSPAADGSLPSRTPRRVRCITPRIAFRSVFLPAPYGPTRAPTRRKHREASSRMIARRPVATRVAPTGPRTIARRTPGARRSPRRPGRGGATRDPSGRAWWNRSVRSTPARRSRRWADRSRDRRSASSPRRAGARRAASRLRRDRDVHRCTPDHETSRPLSGSADRGGEPRSVLLERRYEPLVDAERSAARRRCMRPFAVISPRAALTANMIRRGGARRRFRSRAETAQVELLSPSSRKISASSHRTVPRIPADRARTSASDCGAIAKIGMIARLSSKPRRAARAREYPSLRVAELFSAARGV